MFSIRLQHRPLLIICVYICVCGFVREKCSYEICERDDRERLERRTLFLVEVPIVTERPSAETQRLPHTNTRSHAAGDVKLLAGRPAFHLRHAEKLAYARTVCGKLPVGPAESLVAVALCDRVDWGEIG